jgi:carbonic anhydrase/acetyltransferase-like protein (isoleucine patch superfamily)
MPVRAHHGVFPILHPSVLIADGAFVIGDVHIGKDASIWYNAVLRGDINAIWVGERSNIQDGCVMHVTRELPVIIGNDVTIGHQAVIHGCTIDNCALIGMGAMVLDSAKVGSFSIVAAGAVVLEKSVVPEGTLVAGIPARVIRNVTEEERQRLLESALNYVAYAQSFLIEHKGA